MCRRESHDRSKKHQDKVRALRQTLLEEDGIEEEEPSDMEGRESDDQVVDEDGEIIADDELKPDQIDDVSVEEADVVDEVKVSKKAKKKKKKTFSAFEDVDHVEIEPVLKEEDEDDAAKTGVSKTKRRRNKTKATVVKSEESVTSPIQNEADVESDEKSKRKTKKKAARSEQPSSKPVKPKQISEEDPAESTTVSLTCVVCQERFPSKNKLFDHLKATNHAVYVDKSKSADDPKGKKRGKKKWMKAIRDVHYTSFHAGWCIRSPHLRNVKRCWNSRPTPHSLLPSTVIVIIKFEISYLTPILL